MRSKVPVEKAKTLGRGLSNLLSPCWKAEDLRRVLLRLRAMNAGDQRSETKATDAILLANAIMNSFPIRCRRL